MLVFSSNIQSINGHHVKNINLELCTEHEVDREIWILFKFYLTNHQFPFWNILFIIYI